MILAIETSTPVCSVAVGEHNRVLAEKRIEGRGVHSERTFTFIKELLDRFDAPIDSIEAVLFSHGPGSYTGLRIGAGAVKGLLFEKRTPLFTLPTLLGFAISALQKGGSSSIHAVIDARRNHLYHQKVKKITGKDIEVSQPKVVELQAISEEIKKGDVVVGTGWDRLDVSNKDDVRWMGREAVSANNLINGWYNPDLKPFFEKQDPELFEPEYLSMNQINNSSVAG